MRKRMKHLYKSPLAWLVIPPTLIAIAIFGYFGYDAYLDYLDKRRFETVHASIEVLHGRLQEVAGAGEDWKMYASCSQASVKFEEGEKSCELRVSAKATVTDDSQARALIDRYGNLFRQMPSLFVYEGEGSPPRPVNFPSGLEAGSDGASFREKDSKMSCGSLFSINTYEEDVAERVLHMSFSCNDYSRELHYPKLTSAQIDDLRS